jgi:hypothetical protein
MPTLRRRRSIVAVVAVVGLILAGVVAAAAAGSRPNLPQVSPQQLVASVVRSTAAHPPVSGRVDAWADLGIPDLVAGGFVPEGSVLAGLGGVHHLRVWESKDGLRLTELLPTNERSIFASRPDRQAWAWDSASFTAYRLTPPARGMKPPGAGEAPRAGGETPGGYANPLALARQLLGAVNRSTSVRVEGTERVAGRDAYRLVVRPRTTQTLVGQIDIAVDAEHRLPLSVTITPRSSGRVAAFVRFTSVDFGPVDPSVYHFTPPQGARVETPSRRMHPVPGPPVGPAGALGQARTFGTGWATVVAVPVRPPDQLRSPKGSDIASLFPLSAPLFSAQLVHGTEQTWLVFGMVPPSALERVAAELS